MMIFIPSAVTVLQILTGAILIVAVPVKRQLANIISSCNQPGTVALTFDDGPYIYTNVVSDILTENNATGTFFFNGNNWACIYDPDMMWRVQYAYNAGHMLASHSWSHPDLGQLSWDQIHNEMWLIEEAIFRITGAYPAFFRPPYGSFNEIVLAAAHIRGQQLVLWDLVSGDSVGASAAQQKHVYDNAIARGVPNMLALNHDAYSTAVYETLPYAIKQLQNAGYQLVALDVCLGGEERYQYVGEPQTYDPHTWHCH